MARTLDVEKVAEPLFRVRPHEIFVSISYEIVGKKFREKCHFRGAEGELAEGQEKPPWGVSSKMTRLNFIPSSACARRRVSERNRRKAAALSAEMTTELLAGGLF